MNRSTYSIASATCATLFAALFILPQAFAASDAVLISTQSPLRATLLPTVSVTANALDANSEARWQVADSSPLRVTLMPTVSVFASSDALAVTTLPTVYVVAHTEPAAIHHVAVASVISTMSEVSNTSSTSEQDNSDAALFSPIRSLLVTR